MLLNLCPQRKHNSDKENDTDGSDGSDSDSDTPAKKSKKGKKKDGKKKKTVRAIDCLLITFTLVPIISMRIY